MTSKRMHVTYGKDKVVISCTSDQLKTAIEDKFQVDGAYTLQIWDEEFSDWVNLEEETQLEDSMLPKLLVVKRFV